MAQLGLAQVLNFQADVGSDSEKIDNFEVSMAQLGGSKNVELHPIIPIWTKLDLIVKIIPSFIKNFKFLSYFNPCSAIIVIFTYDNKYKAR